MITTKTPPVFTARADEVTIGDFIVRGTFTPVSRPVITRVTGVEQVGDDMIITTTMGEFVTSEGTLLTCLGKTLDIR